MAVADSTMAVADNTTAVLEHNSAFRVNGAQQLTSSEVHAFQLQVLIANISTRLLCRTAAAAAVESSEVRPSATMPVARAAGAALGAAVVAAPASLRGAVMAAVDDAFVE